MSRLKLNRYVVKCAFAGFFVCYSLHAMAFDDVAQPASNNTDYQPNNLAVTLNGRALSDGVLILQSNNNTMLPAQLLSDARIRLPTIQAYRFHDENYYPVSAIAGLKTHVDPLTQTLDIQAPAGAFVESQYHLNNDNNHAPLQASAVGAFVNYDLNYSRNANVNAVSGLAEAGVFNGHGTFTTRFVGVDRSGGDIANAPTNTNKNSVFRLDSQYTQDFPSQMATLVVGDSISGASNFSRQVYFGGLQWRTNFATVPGYQSIPLPSMSGSAAVPSTVDIYVDNILRMRQAVDAGPFTINNLPVVTGQGNVQMVVNDVLGRQQIYTQSYIASAQLLQAGIKNVSYEIGALRNNFGLQNSYYGSAFSSATVRYGVSDNLTTETHGEITAGHQSVGTGASVAIHNLGVISGGAAVSNSDLGNGTLQYLQFDRQNSLYALTVRAQTANARFWQLGLDANTSAPTRQIQAQASVTLNANTNISFGYLDQRAPQVSYLNNALTTTNTLTNFRAINAGINFNLRQAGTVSLGVFKSMGDGNTLSTNITWILPLDNQRLLSLSANLQKDNNSYNAQFQQTAPQEGGWGYRLRKTLETNAGEDIGANYLNDTGEYSVAASRLNDNTNLLADVRGGFVMMGGYVRPTRWLDTSFAMVVVPTFQSMPGIDIYSNNIKVGTTDSAGVAVIPRLVPYVENKVNLDDANLPISMTLDLAPQTVVPIPRSGSFIKFEVEQNKSATLILQGEDGEPLPNGTQVRLKGHSAVQEVALHGEVFVADMRYPATVVIDHGKNSCVIQIDTAPSNQDFPVLGPYICH